MTPEELLANLAPIRVPLDFARMDMRDVFVALCLGILAGLVLVRLIAFLTSHRPDPLQQAQAEIAKLATEDHGSRLIGLAGLLRQYNPQAAQDEAPGTGLKEALYDPGAKADFAAIEQAILAGARRHD